MAKQPKHMQSRFDSTCSHCGGPIYQGEDILYLGRGKAHCRHCVARAERLDDARRTTTHVDVPVDAPSKTGANDWADALAWQPAPEPGKSIEGKRPSKPDNVYTITPSEPVPISSLIEKQPHDVRTRLEADTKQPEPEPTIAELNYPHQFEDKPEPVYKPLRVDRDDPPAIDDAVAIVRDLLVAVVNAIDNADRDQRAALDSIARDMMTHAGSMPRSRIWAAIADAINA